MSAPTTIRDTLLSIAREAALTNGLINLSDPDVSPENRHSGHSKRINLPDGTPALVYIGNCYRDEWIVSITLWPTSDAEHYMDTSSGRSRAGEVFAWGWLNRWQYRGRAIGIERFHDARAYVAPARRGELAVLLASHVAAA